MSLKESKKIETNLYQLTIDIDSATFEAAVDKVYRKSVKNITIPGFRRGKAPRTIVEKMYGKGVFYEDAINDLLPTVYPAALKESGIEAVSQPEFDIESVDENGVVLIAKVYVKPEVSIDGYKGIEEEKTVEISGTVCELVYEDEKLVQVVIGDKDDVYSQTVLNLSEELAQKVAELEISEGSKIVATTSDLEMQSLPPQRVLVDIAIAE